MSNNNRLVNPKAQNAMDHLKYEVTQYLGLDDDIQNRGWENMTTREVGKIGGNMVKKWSPWRKRRWPINKILKDSL
ncbi:alpha/beta-type small acid-soluble spore protein [Tepidibacillus marianensis]|uniref:alpha/beta-type small acid-soluble spore protein n=1 Tax=Tepidibacillus marianensis TaxID=3131995 RepID=UPI0030D4F8FD